jgi:hypothetical protein
VPFSWGLFVFIVTGGGLVRLQQQAGRRPTGIAVTIDLTIATTVMTFFVLRLEFLPLINIAS